MSMKAPVKYLASLLLIGVAGLETSVHAAVPNAPTLPIEQKYYSDGPWAVTSTLGFACCDSSGNKFDIWYPTNLGAGGFLHPIVTWGNGTGGTPATAPAYLLRHLATWGFVVVASESGSTWNGQPILDAANYMVGLNSNSASPFYHKLATTQIGAVGQSQGANGVLNALTKSGGSIKTIISIEEPAQQWCILNASQCLAQWPTTANISYGSAFFVNGSADTVVSPSTQLGLCSPISENSDACFYVDTPFYIPKAWATLIGANHNDIGGQPDCSTASWPCNNGVYGYLGYPTAWLMDQLQADTYAHGAFVSGFGEIFRETTNWQNQISNIP